MEQVLSAGKVPPQNIEAEQSTLGSMMIDPSALEKATETLRPEDFYRPSHQEIFDSLTSLAERDEPVDVITLQEELRRRGKLENVGGAEYLFTLVETVPTASNIQYYANIVEHKAILRRLIAAGQEIIGLANSEDDDIDEITNYAESAIFSVAQRRMGKYFTHIGPLVDYTWDWIEKRYENKGAASGLPTGFNDFDGLTSGLQKSDLVILAARPSMGKTAFALNIGVQAAADQNATVAIFSLEMSAEQLAQRIVCARARANAHKLRTGNFQDDDWRKVAQATNELTQAPLYIDDTTDMSVLSMRSKCRRLKSEHGLSLVIVDYLQLMRGHRRSESRQQEISDIARGLKSLARELNVPVIALSQLSRAVEKRDDKRPMLSDLRESGSIEAEADLVIMLYRDAYYKRKELISSSEFSAENNPEEDDTTTEVIVAKHRNGPTGVIKLSFQKDYASFENMDEYHSE